jgi:hypothetical protein
MRRRHRALNAVAAIIAVATTMIGGAGAVAQTPADGREAHSVTIHARETPPTGYPTATPVAEEPEHPIVGLFRAVLIVGMLFAVGMVMAVAMLVRGVKRRRSGRQRRSGAPPSTSAGSDVAMSFSTDEGPTPLA